MGLVVADREQLKAPGAQAPPVAPVSISFSKLDSELMESVGDISVLRYDAGMLIERDNNPPPYVVAVP